MRFTCDFSFHGSSLPHYRLFEVQAGYNIGCNYGYLDLCFVAWPTYFIDYVCEYTVLGKINFCTVNSSRSKIIFEKTLKT